MFSYISMILGSSSFESDTRLEMFIEKTETGYACTVCGKCVRDRSAARNHVEALHVPSQGHNCEICGKFLKTKNALWIHNSRIHNNKMVGP